MQKVNLCTGDGAVVTTAHIPLMNPMPEIICWGGRWFVHYGGHGSTSETYHEGLLWVVPSKNTGGAP